MGGGLEKLSFHLCFEGNYAFPVPAQVNVAPPQIPGKHRERKNGEICCNDLCKQ